MASRLMATSLDHSDTKVGFTYCKSVLVQHLSATVTTTPNINKQAIVRNILNLLTLWVLVIQSNNINGGGGGIRTHEPNTRLTVFKTAAFNRSATPPHENSFHTLTMKHRNSLRLNFIAFIIIYISDWFSSLIWLYYSLVGYIIFTYFKNNV